MSRPTLNALYALIYLSFATSLGIERTGNNNNTHPIRLLLWVFKWKNSLLAMCAGNFKLRYSTSVRSSGYRPEIELSNNISVDSENDNHQLTLAIRKC